MAGASVLASVPLKERHNRPMSCLARLQISPLPLLICPLLLLAQPVPAAQTIGPVTDEIGVIRIPKAAPVQIGAYWVLSGPDTALGLDSRRGAQIAIHDLGGKILGHPIKLNVEDDQCSAEGGQTAAIKLAANPQTVIVLGPGCSSAATPGAPILWQAGITNICNACSAPALTDPSRKPDYAGFARTIASDKDQGASDARYIFEVLKAKTLATIHDGSAYSQQLTAVTARNFIKLGGQVLAQEAVAPTDVDMHPVLSRIAAAKPDALYAPIFIAPAAQILRQSKETPGLDHTTLIGGGSVAAPDFIEAAGPSVVGFRICFPDVTPDAMGKGYGKLVDEYKEMFGEAPTSGFHANAYDAVMAIETVGKTDKDGNLYIGKKALRDAVYASKFDGLSGRIDCDAYGQCASFKPATYEFTSADPKTFAIGKNPKKIWP